jgi:hypothetical protein
LGPDRRRKWGANAGGIWRANSTTIAFCGAAHTGRQSHPEAALVAARRPGGNKGAQEADVDVAAHAWSWGLGLLQPWDFCSLETLGTLGLILLEPWDLCRWQSVNDIRFIYARQERIYALQGLKEARRMGEAALGVML